MQFFIGHFVQEMKMVELVEMITSLLFTESYWIGLFKSAETQQLTGTAVELFSARFFAKHDAIRNESDQPHIYKQVATNKQKSKSK